ncbi:hypothetical protein JL720_16689 [Aureococcus anophagefferens]|nr:hypothetical protein JL720_16689 [Aureococcus anophagefferens]
MASFEEDSDLQEESDDYSYESGEDDNASDSEAETSPPQQPYPVSLSEEEVASEARRRATAVQRALGCSAFAARVALRLGRWQHAAADDGRYAFYSERSAAHGASRAFATTQLEKSHKLAKNRRRVRGPDASFLPNAVALVVRCRATLESSSNLHGELSGLTEQKAADVADARRRIVFLAAALTKYRANIADWGA